MSNQFAVLSDIHGNLEALTEVLEQLDKFNVKEIYILGDLIDYCADSVEVINLLYSLKHYKGYNIKGIRGNHEEFILNGDTSLIKTPYGKVSAEITKREVCTPGVLNKLNDLLVNEFRLDFPEMSIVHGSLSNPINGIPEVVLDKDPFLLIKEGLKGCRPVFCGHTHIQGCGEYYINPGSVGQPRNGDPRSQFIICSKSLKVIGFKQVEYDIDTTAAKIVKSGRPEFLAQRLYLGL